MICISLAFVHNHFGMYFKYGRSNNGSKFLSKECQSNSDEKGIIQQRNVVYTTQQNGVVEKKISTFIG